MRILTIVHDGPYWFTWTCECGAASSAWTASEYKSRKAFDRHTCIVVPQSLEITTSGSYGRNLSYGWECTACGQTSRRYAHYRSPQAALRAGKRHCQNMHWARA